jgi:hypothetical protein
LPTYNNDTLVFIHVPRTGGTLIELALRDVYDDEKFWGLDESGFTKQHYPLERLKSELSEPFFSFTIVRNPFDRIVSSFLNYTRQNIPDFNVYLAVVRETVTKKLYESIPGLNTNDTAHYMPQSLMVGEPDFIGKFETFDADMERLAEASGIEAFRKIKIRKSNAPYRDFYTPEGRELMEKIYKEDLERFDYGF